MIRDRIFNECTMVLSQAREAKHTVLLAGDWNGTVQDNDRASGKTYDRDRKLRQFLADTHLQHTDPPPSDGGPRAYTYLRGKAAFENSRIDDIYMQPKEPSQHVAQSTHTTVIDTVGTYFDHHGLLFQMPFATVDLLPPPAPAVRRGGIRYPP
jgi:hypothetical protein